MATHKKLCEEDAGESQATSGVVSDDSELCSGTGRVLLTAEASGEMLI
jgi:hypothetical protein